MGSVGSKLGVVTIDVDGSTWYRRREPCFGVTAMMSGRKSDAKWCSSNILGKRLWALNWTIEISADDEFDGFFLLE